ncbi:MAG: VOC family protein [Gammaproteobacteria bacterium]|nr:VOC family protein [Gammaproteobacteria bacterium]
MSTAAVAPFFQRANLIVRDLEHALTVYRDVLGFSVDYIIGGEDIAYSWIVFGMPAQAQLRLCTLSTPTQQRTLALTEVRGVDLPPLPKPRLAAAVIRVADMDRVSAALLSTNGVEVMQEQVLHTQDGRRGRERGVVDSDGHLIVLYSIDSAV